MILEKIKHGNMVVTIFIKNIFYQIASLIIYEPLTFEPLELILFQDKNEFQPVLENHLKPCLYCTKNWTSAEWYWKTEKEYLCSDHRFTIVSQRFMLIFETENYLLSFNK